MVIYIHFIQPQNAKMDFLVYIYLWLTPNK